MAYLKEQHRVIKVTPAKSSGGKDYIKVALDNNKTITCWERNLFGILVVGDTFDMEIQDGEYPKIKTAQKTSGGGAPAQASQAAPTAHAVPQDPKAQLLIAAAFLTGTGAGVGDQFDQNYRDLYAYYNGGLDAVRKMAEKKMEEVPF